MEGGKKIESLSELFGEFPEVIIEAEGTSKYVLISLSTKDKKDCVYLLRGYNTKYSFHAEIFENFQIQVRDSKLLDNLIYQSTDSQDGHKIRDILKVECVGGGRIDHDRNISTKILVFL